MASYRALVYATDRVNEFQPGELLVEFENPKSLGYAEYLNDIGECFFSISQFDAKVDIRSEVGTAHVVIIRNAEGYDDVVWRGILAEIDATQDDVIYYAYGYLAQLYTLYSKWNQEWKNQEVAGAAGTPVNDLWERAQTLTDSPLGFVTTGTLEAPSTTDADDIALVLTSYRCNYKRILQAFRELVAVSTSDTNNIVYMEIDYPTDPTDLNATFNFWADRTADATDIRLEFPGNIMHYSDRFAPVLMRNKTLGVGVGPKDQIYRFNWTVKPGSYGRDNFGMHQEALYLTWVRDMPELKRVVKRRTRLALREDVNVYVRMFAGSLSPWRSTPSLHNIGDRIYTQVVNGITRWGKWLTMMGEQTLFISGREYVQPILEDRAGVKCPDEAGIEQTATAGTSITLHLPDAKYEVGRHILMAIAWTNRANVDVDGQLTGLGFTRILVTPTTAAPDYAMNWYWKRVDGTEGYPRKNGTLALTLAQSAKVVANIELLSGVYDEYPSNPGPWYELNPNTSTPLNPDALSQSISYSEFTPTRLYAVLLTNGAAITGSPVGYLAFDDITRTQGTGSDLNMRVTRKNAFNVAEDPSPFTGSGALISHTLRIRGDC